MLCHSKSAIGSAGQAVFESSEVVRLRIDFNIVCGCCFEAAKAASMPLDQVPGRVGSTDIGFN